MNGVLVLMVIIGLGVQPAPPARPGTPAGVPAGPALQPPVELDPRTAFADIVKAYQHGPTRERLGVSAGVGARTDQRRGVLEVELHPGTAPGFADARVVIEAGPLRVDADAEAIRTTMKDNPDTVCSAAVQSGGVTTADLARALPPLPAPGLALLRTAAGDAPQSLLPWASGAAWTKAVLDADAREGPTLTIEGKLPDGRITVTADAETGRLRLITMARGATPDATTHITVHVTPLPVRPPEAGAGREDAGRVEVGTLADLSRRLSELLVGSSAQWVGDADGGATRVVLLTGAGLSADDEASRMAKADEAWALARVQLGEGVPDTLVRAGVDVAAASDVAPGMRMLVSRAAARALKGGGVAIVMLGEGREGRMVLRAWIPVAVDADAGALAERLLAAHTGAP